MASNDDEQQLAIAWAAWCDELGQAGHEILAGGWSLADKAEGLRWLSRMARYGLEAGVEFSDVHFPTFYMPTHETVKVMSDNPDALHWMATIRDDAEYVLHGQRGNNPRIMFTILGRGKGGGMIQQTGIDTGQLDVAPDGSFRIHVSREPRNGNWLPLHDGAHALLIRALFFDRTTEIAPTVRLEEVNGPKAPPPLDAATMAARLDRARTITQGTAHAIRRYGDELRERGWINRFGEKPASWAAGDPGVHYWHGAWQLGPDEALVVDISPADCFFWNFQINNRWAESLDYRHRRIHLNSHNAVATLSGPVRAVLAARDPGLPNWLDTEEHCEGTMLIRSIDAAAAPGVTTQVVPFAALKDLA